MRNGTLCSYAWILLFNRTPPLGRASGGRDYCNLGVLYLEGIKTNYKKLTIS